MICSILFCIASRYAYVAEKAMSRKLWNWYSCIIVIVVLVVGHKICLVFFYDLQTWYGAKKKMRKKKRTSTWEPMRHLNQMEVCQRALCWFYAQSKVLFGKWMRVRLVVVAWGRTGLTLPAGWHSKFRYSQHEYFLVLVFSVDIVSEFSVFCLSPFLLLFSLFSLFSLLLLLSLSMGFKLHNQQKSVKCPKGNQNIYIMYLQLDTVPFLPGRFPFVIVSIVFFSILHCFFGIWLVLFFCMWIFLLK